MAEHVAAIRGRLDLEDVIREAERELRGLAERGRVVRVEHDDARVILRQAELVLGAQHAGRDDALDGFRREREPAGQRRADLRPQHLAAGLGNIGGAAHDLRRRAAACGDDVDERELVGIGVRPLRDDLGDDDAREARAEIGQRFDLEAAARQCRRALLDRRLRVEVTQLEQPAPQDLH